MPAVQFSKISVTALVGSRRTWERARRADYPIFSAADRCRIDVVLLNPRQQRHERYNNTSGVRQEDDMQTNYGAASSIGRVRNWLLGRATSGACGCGAGRLNGSR